MTLLRHEDRRLITGRGHFTSDWQLAGQVHAVIVRSDRANARVLGVDTGAARSSPGVLAVVTAADVAEAGLQPVPSGPDLKGVGGMAQRKKALPVLADSHVAFVGQPVAMVVAETLAQARDAAEAVVVDYEDLAAVVDTRGALAPDSPRVHADIEGNLSLHFEAGDRAAVEAAFAAAAKTTTLEVVSQRLAGAPMELRACTAAYDAQRDVTTVYTPTQGLLGMRSALGAMTGIAHDKLEIIADDVGGSFGLRGGAYPETALVVMASRQLGRPVRWCATRAELFTGEWHGRALTLKGSIALDADDNILAIRFEDLVDLGAYNCYFGGFIGTNNLSVTMGGTYRVPALYMQSRLVFTNKVPVSAYRGAGRPDIAFAIERLIDHTAAEHGLDPVEFRRRNFVPVDAFPYTTATGTVYDCGDFAGVMDKALRIADYAGFEARRAEAGARGRLRGIGFGCYLEKSGAGGAPSDQVCGQFSADGGLMLYAVTGPSGQGHETSFAQIVGGGLGIPVERIGYRPGDPSRTLVGNGTGGSRSLYGAGSAFKNLVTVIVDKARVAAAGRLGVAPDSLTFEAGRFVAADGQGLSMVELVQALAPADGGAHPLDSEAHTVTGANYPNGCHVAELEIDPDTGATEIIAYTAVDDLGNIVSPELVRGQVHGGVVQGAGQAFVEQIVYDEQGQLLTGSFMDYGMPRAGTVGRFVVDPYPVPTALNELGAKGVGESGCSGSMPAISNAMADALRSRGLGPIDMPFTPARVWATLQAR
ncbi:MAG: xanthine dehydrogenase family protein molybdopterin-binding subunit [Burkholderiaceae bacterium]